MIKKQGITLTVMTITIIILIILAGTISISVYSTLNYSRLSTWANELMYVQDVVNEQLNKSSMVEDTTETININISALTQEQKEEQFKGETISTDNLVELAILDLGKLSITNTMYGNLETQEDVYAVSLITGKVYYVQGFETDNVVYYTLTTGLKQRFDLTSNANLNSIVFMPNKLGYTNMPVKVTIKVPKSFSSIAISTSNEAIQIGSQVVVGNLYEYIVNVNEVAGNYIIKVTYNDGVQIKTTEYEVNGYDIVSPVISEITRDNLVYKETETSTLEYLTKIVATDDSGIKYLKYSLGKISEDEAQEYFSQNGNVVVDGKINLDKDIAFYTIYAEDLAGNFDIDIINVDSLKGWVQNGFSVVNGEQVLEIGDIVKYDETVGGKITNLTETDWKVLGTDGKGNLLIMSTTDVKTGYRLGYESTDTTNEAKIKESQNDWLNGAKELDAVCEPYGKGSGVVGSARSITVEDVNAVTGYNPKTTYNSDAAKAGEIYGKGKIYQYGNKVTYKYNLTAGETKPMYESKVVSGTLSNAHENGFYYCDGKEIKHITDLATGERGKTFAELTSNAYYYYAPNLSTISATNNPKAFEMIFGKYNEDRGIYSNYYWLASTYVNTYDFSAFFGMRCIGEGGVYLYLLFRSNGDVDCNERGVRAVVTLSRDIKFTGSSDAGWSY